MLFKCQNQILSIPERVDLLAFDLMKSDHGIFLKYHPNHEYLPVLLLQIWF